MTHPETALDSGVIAPPQSRGAGVLRSLWQGALDLLYPPRCVGCRAYGDFVCTRCRGEMVEATEPRCPSCWARGAPAVCHDCRTSRPAFTAARAAFVFEGTAREAVHALKYDGVSALAPVMAREMAEQLLCWGPPVSVIVPVPLAGGRRRRRGYNQSELLAREVGRITGLRVGTRALVRRQTGAPQVHQTDRAARRRNVQSAFAPGLAPATGGLLVIDDVITTGATAHACARVLLSAGATAVYVLSYARED